MPPKNSKTTSDFAMCPHTCQHAQSANHRRDGLENSWIYLKRGSSLSTHLDNDAIHLNCSPRCPGYKRRKWADVPDEKMRKYIIPLWNRSRTRQDFVYDNFPWEFWPDHIARPDRKNQPYVPLISDSGSSKSRVDAGNEGDKNSSDHIKTKTMDSLSKHQNRVMAQIVSEDYELESKSDLGGRDDADGFRIWMDVWTGNP